MKTTLKKHGDGLSIPGILTALALILTSGLSHSATITTFGETVPLTNIITSYEPGSQDQNAWFNDGPTNNGIRFVSQSFITPGDSDYLLSAITMKFNLTLATSFPSAAPFSIDFYQVGDPSGTPIGTYLSSRGGSMQPTTLNATAGSYFTFTLDTGLDLTAGASYAYVLAFDDADPSHLFRLAISSGAADPAGTRGWQNTNAGGWVNTNETYVYYIQGAPVPEPGVLGLLGFAAMGSLLLRRRSRQSVGELL